MTKFKKIITIVTFLVMLVVILQIPAFMFSDQLSKSIEEDNLSKQMATPIATTEELNNLLPVEELKKAGIRFYSSEEEYLEEQKKLGQQLMEEWETYEFAPVWHTFTVVDSKSNSPISGAIIIIDGVPRFSDVNGQIQVKVKSEVVELRVEKKGYNPYVEYYNVYSASEKGVTEKTITLKKPTYDMEISDVTVDYNGEKANVVNQSYTFDKAESYEDTININVKDVKADNYYLYNGNKLIMQGEKDSDNYIKFHNVPIKSFEKISTNGPVLEEIDGNINIITEKDGILSPSLTLKLGIVELQDIRAEDYLQFKNKDLDIFLDNKNFMGTFKFNFIEMLKKVLGVNKNDVNGANYYIEYMYDNLEGAYKFAFGVEIGLKGKKLKKLEKKAIYNKFTKSYKMRKNNINPNARKQSVSEALWGAFKKVSADSNQIKLSAADIDISFPLEFTGYLEISSKAFTGDLSIKEAIIGGGFDFSIGFKCEWTKHTFIPVASMPIPFYINIGLGGSLNVNYDYKQVAAIQHTIDCILQFNFKFGLGAGVYGLFSAGVYGKGDIIVDDETEVLFSCGILIGILGHDIDYKLIDKKDITELKLSTLSENTVQNSNGGFIDARPSSTYIDGTKLSVWIEKDLSRSQYNESKLMYSYGDKTGSVYDDGKADYYPELTVIDNEAYVVWHKSSVNFNGNEDVSYVFGKSIVAVSKFNKQTQSFDVIKQFDTDSMATLPKIAQNSSNGQISVLWLNNTENNPLGTSGTNNIYASECLGGAWSEPELVFSIDKPIMNYDAGYVNGVLKVACSVDMDGNIEIMNDVEIFFGTKGNLENINNDNIMQRDPKFGNLKGIPVLYYLQDNEIHAYLINLGTDLCIATSYNMINSFELIEEVGGAVLYVTEGGEGQQLNLVTYNEAEDTFENNIRLYTDKNYISIDTCVNDSELEIQGVTFDSNDSGDGIEIKGVDSEIVKISTDIVLLEAYLLDNVKIGLNNIYLYIQNKGSYPISSFNYSINGNIFSHQLEEELEPNSDTVVCVQWQCSMITECIEVSIDIGSEDNMDNNCYRIDTDYSDLSMDIMKIYDKNGKETLHILIDNNMPSEQNFKILIHRDDKEGEIIYTSENMLIEANGSNEINVTLDYYQLNCSLNDKLFVEIQTNQTMLVPCEKTVVIEENVVTYNRDQITEAASLLVIAKRITGGII